MRTIKGTIEDYISSFHMKSRSEKIKAVRILFVQLVVIVGLICAPPIITRIHTSLEGEVNGQRLPELSDDDKWNLVRIGRLRFECLPGTDDAIRKVGLDPASPQGTNYAITHGLCDFRMN